MEKKHTHLFSLKDRSKRLLKEFDFVSNTLYDLADDFGQLFSLTKIFQSNTHSEVNLK